VLSAIDDNLSFVVGLIQGGKVRGSGVVVSLDRVVTAGHCVEYAAGGGPLRVFFGREFNKSSLTTSIQRVFLHPRYSPYTTSFDLAVLVLEKCVPFGITPATICSPGLKWRNSGLMNFAGFGNSETPYVSGLKRRTARLRIKSLSPSIIWTESPKSGPCRGDSGGPFLVRVDGEDIVVGIESGGDPSCRKLGRFVRLDSRPGAFVRLHALATAKKILPG
jgi:secreted trypsin-like serine protease